MKASEEFLKDNKIVPFISFKEKPQHIVTLKTDERESIINDKGKEVFGVTYFVEEAGEERKFFTSSISLIQKLAQYKADDEVIITMKKKKIEPNEQYPKGTYKSYYIVSTPEEALDKELEGEEEFPEIH